MTARERYPSDKYPFSDQLCCFMDKHTDFFNSLKIEKNDRFKYLQPLAVIYLPENHQLYGDEILGFFYFDNSKCECNFHKGRCQFKQDFVVNLGTRHVEFISYTHTDSPSQYVRPTKEFFEKYGNGCQFFHNGFEWQHHYKNVEDLPDFIDHNSGQCLRQNARKALGNAWAAV